MLRIDSVQNRIFAVFPVFCVNPSLVVFYNLVTQELPVAQNWSPLLHFHEVPARQG